MEERTELHCSYQSEAAPFEFFPTNQCEMILPLRGLFQDWASYHPNAVVLVNADTHH